MINNYPRFCTSSTTSLVEIYIYHLVRNFEQFLNTFRSKCIRIDFCGLVNLMPENFFMKSFIKGDGERYCLLVDQASGTPLYYPNLFVTTQVRNKSLSYSSMEAALGGVSVLLKFMIESKDNLESRFQQRRFFEVHEMDALRDFCQIKFSTRTISKDKNSVFSLAELRESDETISSSTEYVRLTVISNYVRWLAELLTGESRDRATALRINKMVKGLESRRPIRRGSNNGLVEKGLDEKQLAIIFELFRPESQLNPFQDESVKVRNRLMFLLLFHLGIRGGELLGIRIRDINFSKNQILIKRSADEIDDTRLDQPLTKTRDRLLPIRDTLANEIHRYILLTRKLIVRKGQPDYLFVTHKNGPTRGLPISKSAYRKVFSIVRIASPDLYRFTGHQLRHVWNERFSELMDSMDEPVTEERQEEMRSYLMGWKPGSGTAAIYNQRYVRRKGQAASLELQKNMIRLPKDLSNE